METTLSEKLVARLAKERRGEGSGASYVPGLTQRQIARGVGRMHRFCCTRCGGRQIILGSDAELATFLLAHWNPQTCDLNEYVPLTDPAETESIALRLGIAHPRMRDGSPSVLRTGLMALRKTDKGHAWTAFDTLACQLDPARAAPDSMRIVSEYWRQRGVSWQLNRSGGFNDCRVRNLWQLFPHSEYMLTASPDADDQVQQDALLAELRRCRYRSLREACHAAARATGRPLGDGVRAGLQLLATRRIVGRIDLPDLLLQPLGGLKVTRATRCGG
ncbi:hypothetical protein [Paraburkholderia sp. MM5482-R1]|uniref:hypothetical protein n=1 Tax=unclassified Paraburkholderia TaxID=2615204 RepID=UPI003D1AD0F3